MENKQQIFDRLFADYRDWVYRLCYSYTRSEAQAEDLMQECFAKIWMHLDGFQQRSDIGTWVYRIAANTCLMQLRKEKNNPVTYYEQISEKLPEDAAHDQEQQSQQLYNAIAQLTDIDRLIISMILEDLPQKQIGDVLGITENNVNVKVHRIKKQLKAIMSKNQ
ncbi:MAG: sigma-70 family RNA polymerase sigma factor [Sphingobacteriales bacterium]|nr:MAG: sigma-70 family RNA polymerase sigma factor [Sphingobacteriales bacterium]